MKILDMTMYKESKLAKQRARELEIREYELRPFRNVSAPVMREMLRSVAKSPKHAKTLVNLVIDSLTDKEIESLLEYISSKAEEYKREMGQL